LPALVREGRFREDLFYRLNVLPIRVPSLRERRSDIPALVEALTEDLAHRSNMPPPEWQPDALALLAGQAWRGNIRELRNVLEQAAMSCDTARIDASQLASVLRGSGLAQIAPALAAAEAPRDAGSDLLRPLAEQVAALERRAIDAALQATGGNKLATARLLGISRATLYQRLENPDSSSDS
jgi:DNA-binding NtrC family response regulator